jgi:hypothetical protein
MRDSTPPRRSSSGKFPPLFVTHGLIASSHASPTSDARSHPRAIVDTRSESHPSRMPPGSRRFDPSVALWFVFVVTRLGALAAARLACGIQEGRKHA